MVLDENHSIRRRRKYQNLGFLPVQRLFHLCRFLGDLSYESLRFAAFAKESFDDLVEKAKHWSMDLVVYLSEQKSHFITPQKFESLQFFNLTTSPIQEESVFNRHIGTDYIQEVKEFEEEDEVVTEESDVVDEDVTEEIDEQSEVVNEEIERIEEPINEQIQSDVNEVEEKSLNLGEVEETKSEVTLEAESERVQNDVEIESSVAVSNDESEASSLFSTQSIATISVAGVSMPLLVLTTRTICPKSRVLQKALMFKKVTIRRKVTTRESHWLLQHHNFQ
ncbi:hypothetical protein Hanom_Chr12g01173341 [Helianthus anomalus]